MIEMKTTYYTAAYARNAGVLSGIVNVGGLRLSVKQLS